MEPRQKEDVALEHYGLELQQLIEQNWSMYKTGCKKQQQTIVNQPICSAPFPQIRQLSTLCNMEYVQNRLQKPGSHIQNKLK